MSSLDRTSEFFSLIDVLKKHEGTEENGLVQLQRSLPGSNSNIIGANSGNSSSSSSALYRASRSISEDIRSSQRRIIRLGKLAHRRGLFDDPQKEVLELTQRAKLDLSTIDGAIVSLQREIIAQFGGGVNSSSSSTATSLLSQHWSIVIEILRSLSIKLARDLQTALKARSESIRDQAFRRRDFVHSKWTPAASALPLDSPLFASSTSNSSGGDNTMSQRHVPIASTALSSSSSPSSATNNLPPTSTPPRSQSHTNTTALRRRPQGNGASSSSSSSLSLPYPSSSNLTSGPGRPSAPIPNTFSSSSSSSYQPSTSTTAAAFSGRFNVPMGSTSLRSAQQLSLTHGAISREDDMREVESTIVELGTVFTQVAGLVAEQGELIERIDADMDTASANVEAGYSELGKYFESVKKNRGLIIRLLLVTAFVVFLFAVIKPIGGKRRGWIW